MLRRMFNGMAGLSIKFHFTQFGKLMTAQIDQTLRAALAPVLYAGALRLSRALADATPVGANDPHMREGWSVEGDPATGQLQVVNSHPGLLATDMGRRAAWVPVDQLEPWVRLKIDPDPKKARDIAFAISRYKSEHDTPGQHHFIQPTLEREYPELKTELLREANAALLQAFK